MALLVRDEKGMSALETAILLPLVVLVVVAGFELWKLMMVKRSLYIGTYQDSIYPVIISGSAAQLGNPVSFPNTGFTDMASCQKSASASSISDITKLKIEIFPNPASKSITITLERGNQHIEIYNSQGNLVYQENLNNTTDQQSKEIDISHLPKALYIIKISGESGSRVGKVVKYL